MSYDVMSCLWSHALFLVLFHDVIPWYDVMIGPSHAPGPCYFSPWTNVSDVTLFDPFQVNYYLTLKVT